jgi:glycosyltransferase involved in cell wall biosynthesis
MIGFHEISVVIPCYNEQDVIGETVRRIKALSEEIEIIVVCDGCTDLSAQQAEKEGALVIEHTYNLGNGATVKTGGFFASRDYIVFIDADLQHQPEDIPKLMEFFPGYDLIIGARTNKCNTSAFRGFGNKILICLAQFISSSKIDDLTSGFRAMKKSFFNQFAHLFPQRYSYPTTSTLAGLCSGKFVKFVPIDSVVKRDTGRSNIRPFKDGLRFIEIIIRIIALYRPQKIFVPLSLVLFFIGVITGILQLIKTGGIRSLSVIMMLVGVILFMNGLVVTQLSQMLLSMNQSHEPRKVVENKPMYQDESSVLN